MFFTKVMLIYGILAFRMKKLITKKVMITWPTNFQEETMISTELSRRLTQRTKAMLLIHDITQTVQLQRGEENNQR